MSINKLLTLLFCITAVHGGFAQDANEEAKKQLFNAFRMQHAENARHGSVVVPGEYIKDGDKITGQYYLASYYTTTYKPGNLFIAEYAPDPIDPKVILKYGNCTPGYVRLSDFVISTPAPNTTRLEDKGYGVTMSKNKVRRFYVVEYGADNRVKSVKEGNIVLDKKTGAPAFEYLTSEITYSWKNAHDVTVTTNQYNDKKKAKDEQVKTSSQTYHHIIQKDKLETSDESGRDLVFTTIGKETTLQVKKKGTNDPYRLSNKYITDGEKVVRSENYEYNDQTGAVEKKSITEYTFEKASGSSAPDSDICSFTMKSLTSVYDAQDNLIRQISGGKFRDKNPDGSWGEWQVFRL